MTNFPPATDHYFVTFQKVANIPFGRFQICTSKSLKKPSAAPLISQTCWTIPLLACSSLLFLYELLKWIIVIYLLSVVSIFGPTCPPNVVFLPHSWTAGWNHCCTYGTGLEHTYCRNMTFKNMDYEFCNRLFRVQTLVSLCPRRNNIDIFGSEDYLFLDLLRDAVVVFWPCCREF
jgi:hypothetical protein